MTPTRDLTPGDTITPSPSRPIAGALLAEPAIVAYVSPHPFAPTGYLLVLARGLSGAWHVRALRNDLESLEAFDVTVAHPAGEKHRQEKLWEAFRP